MTVKIITELFQGPDKVGESFITFEVAATPDFEKLHGVARGLLDLMFDNTEITLGSTRVEIETEVQA